MRRTTIFAAALLVGAALAGCAVDESTPNATDNATNRSPTDVTPATRPTPAVTTPAGNATGNGTGNASSNATAPTLRVVATQSGAPGNNTTYAFQAPASVPGGWVKLVLENRGLEVHQAAIYELGNVSLAQFEAMLAGENATGNASQNMSEPRAAGGVNGILPNATGTAWVQLAAGSYVLVCFVPDPVTGMPHAAHGMVRPFTVTPASTPGAPPTSNLTIDLDEFTFVPSANLTAGKHVVRVRNVGNETHELQYFQLAGNATLDDVLESFGPNATGPPPILDAGGFGFIAPAGAGYFEATFAEGRYVFLCFEQDEDDPAPHFALGMVWEVNVTRAP